jgi:hypothetical protein
MTQIFLTILFWIFVAAFICCAIVVIATSFVHKSLLCAKIYTFIFEHDDWLLYKKAKKQGIQHYMNGHHFSQFYTEWNKVKDEYGVDDNNLIALDESTADKLLTKHDELAEKYYYKEYDNVNKIINDGDIVLSLNMYSGNLYIGVGNKSEGLLHWEPMVKDIIKSQVNTRLHGYDDVYKLLLTNPEHVVSF